MPAVSQVVPVGQRQLPEDPAEFERVLGKYKLLTRPLMSGANRICKIAKVEELDKKEQEDGAEAFAALAYQYRLELNAWWLVGMWLFMVALPRAIDWWEAREKRKQQLIPADEGKPKLIPMPPPAVQPAAH